VAVALVVAALVAVEAWGATNMYDTIFFMDRHRVGGNLNFLTNTGIAHPSVKKLWYPDGRVVEDTTGTTPARLAEGIIGIPRTGIGLITRDKFLALMGRYFYWNTETETYEKMFENLDFIDIVGGGANQSILTGPIIDISFIEDLSLSSSASEKIRYKFDIREDAWKELLINSPLFGSNLAAEELLKQLDGSGWPYIKKYFVSGFTSDDQILGPFNSGEEIPPLFNQTATFEDFSTRFAVPSLTEDAAFNYIKNISMVYNHHIAALEEDFEEVSFATFGATGGLNETALPNYYMMYYPTAATNGNIDLPEAYRDQITLNGGVNWSGNVLGGSGTGMSYYNELSVYLNTLSESPATSPSPAAGVGAPGSTIDHVQAIFDARYSNICIRPRSLSILGPQSYLDNSGRPYYNRLPMYIKIQIGLGGTDTPSNYMPQRLANSAPPRDNIFREKLKDYNLWDHFITNLIRVDIDGLMGINDQIESPEQQIACEASIDNNMPDGTVNKTRSLDGTGFLKETLGSAPISLWTMDFYHNWVKKWLDLTSGSNFGTFNNQYNTERVEFVAPSYSLNDEGARGTYLVDSSYYQDTNNDGIFEFQAIDESDPSDIHTNLSDLDWSEITLGNQLRKEMMRTIEEYWNGDDCYSETLMFKIEKRRVPTDLLSIPLSDIHRHTPVQTFYIPNDDNANLIEYIDSQILYGVKYQYDIKTIKLIVGNRISYEDPRAPEELGKGKAVGNALGFYKETEQDLVLPDLNANIYINEAEDTGWGYPDQSGKFVFKGDTSHSVGRVASVGLDQVFVRLQDGVGVNNNINGGAMPDSWNVPLPTLVTLPGGDVKDEPYGPEGTQAELYALLERQWAVRDRISEIFNTATENAFTFWTGSAQYTGLAYSQRVNRITSIEEAIYIFDNRPSPPPLVGDVYRENLINFLDNLGIDMSEAPHTMFEILV